MKDIGTNCPEETEDHVSVPTLPNEGIVLLHGVLFVHSSCRYTRWCWQDFGSLEQKPWAKRAEGCRGTLELIENTTSPVINKQKRRARVISVRVAQASKIGGSCMVVCSDALLLTMKKTKAWSARKEECSDTAAVACVFCGM